MKKRQLSQTTEAPEAQANACGSKKTRGKRRARRAASAALIEASGTGLRGDPSYQSAGMRVKSFFDKLPPLAICSIAVFAFVLVGAAGGYLFTHELSDEAACTQTCAFQNKAGKLEYVIPPERNVSMRGRDRQECRCK